MAQTPSSQQRDDYGYPTQPGAQRKLRNLIVHTGKRIVLSIIFVLANIFSGLVNQENADQHFTRSLFTPCAS